MYKQTGFKQIVFRLKLIILAIVFFVAPTTFAAFELNGVATYSHLGKEQFIAGVYTETLTDNTRTLLLSEGRKRMEIKVVAKSLFSRRFRRMWIEGVAINAASPELEKHAQNLADFSNLLKPRLQKSDILVIDKNPRNGVEIEINGIKLGTIKDASFFDLLLRTWIGPVPLSTSFRTALLQKGTIDPNVLAMYGEIIPTPERVTETEQIIAGLSVPKPVVAAITPDIPKPELTQPKAENKPATKEPKIADVKTEPKPTKQEQNTTKTPNKTAIAAKPEEPKQTPPEQLASAPVLDSLANDLEEDDGPDVIYTAKGLLAQQLYISKLSRWTGPYVKYPKTAIRRNQQGTVRVKVTVQRSGKVIDVAIEEPSRFSSLDKAATKAIKRASPYPAIPSDIPQDTFEFTVPVVFALRTE